jgi:hypothetical protein
MNDAKTVFDASLAALGSPERVAEIQTLFGFAACTSPRGEYTTEVQSGRGRRVWFQQLWTGRNPTEIVINEQGAWVRDTVTDETEALDANSISMIRAHEFQMIPLTLNERFSDTQLEGETEWNGSECLAVRVRDDLEMPGTLYFRKNDGRWAGALLTNQRKTDETVRVVVNEWQRVGEVWLPSTVTTTDSSGDFVLAFKQISINTVDETIFQTPAGVPRAE